MRKLTKAEAYDQALKVWKIIEDAVGYGFNSSHAYSVALDSVYGAYLKAKYPLEYYSVVLNIYENNTKTTAKIMKELDEFNIRVQPIKFGKSKGLYSPDYNTNSIYKGIASIKFLNEKVAEELLDLAKNKYNDFLSLLIDIEENTSCNSKQMKILIKLDFFIEFGKCLTLLESYDKFKERYKKTHKEATKEKRIEEVKEYITTLKESDLPVQDKILFEKEILGYGQTVFPKVNKCFAMVYEIDTKYKPRISLYIMNNGKEVSLKVEKYHFFDREGNRLMNEGDIIKVLKVDKKPKKMKVDNKWVDSDITEDYLGAWEMSRRYEKKSE